MKETDYEKLVEKANKILGFQDCVIELLKLQSKRVDINKIKLSDLVEDYKGGLTK